MRLLLTLLVVLQLAGCAASGTTFQLAPVTTDDLVTLYIYRPSNGFQAGGWRYILIGTE